jgi:hypothetical protein
MDYTLRFPFRLTPGYEISGLQEPCEFKVGGLSWAFKYVSGYYVLKVTGLEMIISSDSGQVSTGFY